MNEQLLSVRDLAVLTGWSPLTIYKKSAAGEIPGRITIGKNSLRFRATEVNNWLFGNHEPVVQSGEQQVVS